MKEAEEFTVQTLTENQHLKFPLFLGGPLGLLHTNYLLQYASTPQDNPLILFRTQEKSDVLGWSHAAFIEYEMFIRASMYSKTVLPQGSED
jgi:hypothetical protein